MLIFDSDCAFCQRCASWLRARGDLPIAAAKELDIGTLGLTDVDTHAAAWWISGDERYSGHLAIVHALRSLKGRWGVVGAILALPPLAAASGVVYRWIADNRGKL